MERLRLVIMTDDNDDNEDLICIQNCSAEARHRQYCADRDTHCCKHYPHTPTEKPNKLANFVFIYFIPSFETIFTFLSFFSVSFLVGENFHFYFRCESQSNCSVPVSSAVFEDPCPGTHKYVEVHYECMLGWSCTYDK